MSTLLDYNETGNKRQAKIKQKISERSYTRIPNIQITKACNESPHIKHTTFSPSTHSLTLAILPLDIQTTNTKVHAN